MLKTKNLIFQKKSKRYSIHGHISSDLISVKLQKNWKYDVIDTNFP